MTHQPLSEFLAEVEARLAATTPGPWYRDEGGVYAGEYTPYLESRNRIADTCWGAPACSARHSKNAALIAHAPEDLKRLVRELKAALARAEAAEAERDELRDLAADAANQWAIPTKHRGWPALCTGGLSTLEGLFSVLGWDDPHIAPERRCEWPGCREHATSGTPHGDGYKRVCFRHFQHIQAENKKAAPSEDETA